MSPPQLWKDCYRLIQKPSSNPFYGEYTYQDLSITIRKHLDHFQKNPLSHQGVVLETRWIPDAIGVLISCLLLEIPLHLRISPKVCQNPELRLPKPPKLVVLPPPLEELVSFPSVDGTESVESSHTPEKPPITGGLSLPATSEKLKELVSTGSEAEPISWFWIGDTGFSTWRLEEITHQLEGLPKLASLFTCLDGCALTPLPPLGFASTKEVNIVEVALLLSCFLRQRPICPSHPGEDYQDPMLPGVYSVTSWDSKPSKTTAPQLIPLFCEESRNRWPLGADPHQGIYLTRHRIRRYEPPPVRVVLTKPRPKNLRLDSLYQHYQVTQRHYYRETQTDIPISTLGDRLTQLLLFSKHYPLFLYQLSESDHTLDRVTKADFLKSWIEIIWTEGQSGIRPEQRRREIEGRILSERRTSKVIAIADRDTHTFQLHVYYLSILGKHYPVLTHTLPNDQSHPLVHRIAPEVSLTPDNLRTFRVSCVVLSLVYYHLLWSSLRIIPGLTKLSALSKLSPLATNPTPSVLRGCDTKPVSIFRAELTIKADTLLTQLADQLRRPLFVHERKHLPRVVLTNQFGQVLGNSDTISAYLYLCLSLICSECFQITQINLIRLPDHGIVEPQLETVGLGSDDPFLTIIERAGVTTIYGLIDTSLIGELTSLVSAHNQGALDDNP